jgi:hypothetical protein
MFGFASVFCQTNQPEVVATAGDFFKPNTSTPSLSWTMGECITESYTSANNILTQGFQQGHYKVDTTGINENRTNYSIKVFPNPTSDFITVSIKPLTEKTSDYLIELYDLQGKKLYTADYNQDEFKLDMLTYPAGTFLLKVMTKGNKALQNFKIQKNK